jgi:kinesin family protein 22
MAGQCNIQVMARLRPMLAREEGQQEVVLVQGRTIFVQAPGGKDAKYTFDTIFDQSATQVDVFGSALPCLQFAMEGLNTTIFTYGQTGTGKTHTMLGHDLWELAGKSARDGEGVEATPHELSYSQEIRGLIPRAMQYVFQRMQGSESKVSVQYLEIYNEKIFDLLREDGAPKVPSTKHCTPRPPHSSLRVRVRVSGCTPPAACYSPIG